MVQPVGAGSTAEIPFQSHLDGARLQSNPDDVQSFDVAANDAPIAHSESAEAGPASRFEEKTLSEVTMDFIEGGVRVAIDAVGTAIEGGILGAEVGLVPCLPTWAAGPVGYGTCMLAFGIVGGGGGATVGAFISLVGGDHEVEERVLNARIDGITAAAMALPATLAGSAAGAATAAAMGAGPCLLAPTQTGWAACEIAVTQVGATLGGLKGAWDGRLSAFNELQEGRQQRWWPGLR